MLEPYDGKLSRTVLRGAGLARALLYPGILVYALKHGLKPREEGSLAMAETGETGVAKQLDSVRSMSVVTLTLLIAMFVIGVALFFLHWFSDSAAEDAKRYQSWRDVHVAMNEGEFNTAVQIATKLRTRDSGYWWSHVALAEAYLANGNLKGAEASYAKAYQLFPTATTRERLDAVRVLLKERGNPGNP